MRTLMVLVMAGVLTGCGVELLTTTAIQGKLQAEQMKAVQGQVGRATETMGQTNIQRAIDTYQAEKGAYPPSLDALVPGWLPTLPKHADGSDYGYDPATGRLLDQPAATSQPMSSAQPPTTADMERLQQIQSAIARYAQEKRAYPPSLQALVPGYLVFLPKTEAGQDFTYSAQSGMAVHPSQQMAATASPQAPAGAATRPAGRPTAGLGGAGPMGEVMTGIGMQNQLNSMSNAGTSAAGGYARRGVQNATQQQNQNQEKALKDLGM